MSDKGKPHNVGQVIFESLGKGLTSLSGILETDRQNKIQDLQLQMNMQVQEARLEKLNLSIDLSKQALLIANETPEQTRERVLREKETETLADIAATEDLFQAVLSQRTGQEGFIPFSSAFGALQQNAEDVGMDFTIPTPLGDFDFGGQAESFNPLDHLPSNLVPTKFVTKQDGTTITYTDPSKVSTTDRVSATTAASQAAILARGKIESEEKKLDAMVAEKAALRPQLEQDKPKIKIINKLIKEQESKITGLRQSFADSLQAGVDIFSDLTFDGSPQKAQSTIPVTTEGVIKALKKQVADGVIVVDDISPEDWLNFELQGYDVKKIQKALSGS